MVVIGSLIYIEESQNGGVKVTARSLRSLGHRELASFLLLLFASGFAVGRDVGEASDHAAHALCKSAKVGS